MRHQRQVRTLERPALEHHDLAAAPLLRRRAEQRHGEAEVVGDPSQREGRSDRRRRDDVVAAGVTETGQRVVLGAEHHVERAGARGGPHRRLEPEVDGFDVEACRRHGLAHPRRGSVLLPRDLGMGVQPVAQRQQRVAARGDVGGHGLARRVHLSSPGTP